MDLLDIAHPDDPAFDMALTGAMLDSVASGAAAASVLRVFRPGPTCAFGRLDRLHPGFVRARHVATAGGWTAVLRYAGGRAVAYDTDCVLVELIRRQKQMIDGLEQRFVELVTLVREALSGLGVDLELGPRPGEYCPGRYSLHLPGGGKVAGVAQRVVPGAALTTAVVVVDGAQRLRTVIGPLYAALDLPVDLDVVGALTDTHPRLEPSRVLGALILHARARYGVMTAAPSAEILAAAAERRGLTDPAEVSLRRSSAPATRAPLP